LAESSTSDLIQTNEYVTRTDADSSTRDVSRVAPRIESIVTNVRVLAIDQTLNDKAGLRIWSGKKFTLELAPDQPKIVTASWSLGMLSLTPRDTRHATISRAP